MGVFPAFLPSPPTEGKSICSFTLLLLPTIPWTWRRICFWAEKWKRQNIDKGNTKLSWLGGHSQTPRCELRPSLTLMLTKSLCYRLGLLAGTSVFLINAGKILRPTKMNVKQSGIYWKYTSSEEWASWEWQWPQTPRLYSLNERFSGWRLSFAFRDDLQKRVL